MRLHGITGLEPDQLTELVALVHNELGGSLSSRGRPYALGLYRSVALVLSLFRNNLTQQVAGEVFGVSQATVSRRWDLLREPIAKALQGCVPTPGRIARGSTVLVDGTLVPTWDWKHRDDLYSGKRHDTGFNLQVAATLGGLPVAYGEPVPGSRHDAAAWQTSGLAQTLQGQHILADLGYIGTGVLTGHKKPPGGELAPQLKQVNKDLSALRAAVERVIAHTKNWKILSHRYRGPLEKLPAMVAAVTALIFFKTFGFQKTHEE